MEILLVLARTRHSSDPKALMVMLAVMALIAVPFAIYFGVVNLRQARKISRHFSLDMLKDHLGEIVTVFGTPEPLEEVLGPGRARVLWYERCRQRYVRSGKSGYWETTGKDTKGTHFYLHFESGGRVLVKCRPKEIQGMPSKTEGGGMFAGTRTLHKWLPLYRQLTVTGRLEARDEGATIMPDRRFGMFISPNSPEKAAGIENAKGLAGVIAAAVLTAGAAVILAVTAAGF